MNTCDQCLFFKDTDNLHAKTGECRNQPPKPRHTTKEHSRDKGRPYAEWPVVYTDDWCGKFEIKPKAGAAVV